MQYRGVVVTAPDPGLTDLIAAHYRTITTAVIYRDDESDGAHRKGFECVCACGDEYMASTRAGDRTEATVLRRADSAHVEVVVEQHTKGRHEWPKTTPTGFTYELPTTYDELNGITADMAQGEIEGWEKTELPPEPTWPMITLAQREIYRQSVRIAELEERIAEAQSLCHDTGRYNAARQKHWNIRVFACDVLAALKGRAALEGEQQ